MLPSAHVTLDAVLHEGLTKEPCIDRPAKEGGTISGSAGRCGLVVGSVRTAVPLELTEVTKRYPPQTAVILC